MNPSIDVKRPMEFPVFLKFQGDGGYHTITRLEATGLAWTLGKQGLTRMFMRRGKLDDIEGALADPNLSTVKADEFDALAEAIKDYFRSGGEWN